MRTRIEASIEPGEWLPAEIFLMEDADDPLVYVEIDGEGDDLRPGDVRRIRPAADTATSLFRAAVREGFTAE